MKHSIKQLFHIDAPREKVFKAISTIEGLTSWWTNQTSGKDTVGGVLSFRFGQHGGPDMKVTGLSPAKQIDWECIESNHGWKGNKLSFFLDENEGKTRVRFSHEGFEKDDDLYAMTTFSWSRYLESLRSYCQAGKGNPFGV